ncbi:disease resistance protein [Pyrus ussuriensis x Pyrus communis]|uniref:Disease resistance protein n=1 Tax=Pyrus ussuriensis x Pyrus communis TaxID=2448454 RepID=A0A5N5F500_9ROSA|nr:disease resistance protein [Pyrus ussuriensis x Pyrus communis]
MLLFLWCLNGTRTIIPELKLLGVVGDKVELAQTKLQFMQGYLKDADARHGHDEDGVRTWVASVRDAAYDLEDVAEAFVLKVASMRKGSVLKRFTCIFLEGVHLHKIGSAIEKITTKISKLRLSLPSYNLQEMRESGGDTSFQRQQERRRSFPYAIEPNVVACADGIETLVVHLIKEKHHRVVSIWGMGGLGKTTLAKQVYNHDGVRCHFDCFAWVCVSQQCHGREVLEELLNQLSSTNEERQEIAKLNEDEIAKRLCTKQQERKCLVVLDYIWTCDVWDSLQAVFPMNGETESQILLTTRNKGVAYCADENGFIYQPLSLNEDESWELFEKITMFQTEDTNPEIYAKKKDLGMKMLRHCEGLPLAITVLGGLLSRKDSADEWDMVHMNFYAYIRRGTDLGPEYEAHFPKDYEIPVNRLTQLWMAEGFVSTSMEKMEDVSYRCLSELVERSMVQVGQHGLTRKIKTCCLHGLMRDLCMVKAKEGNILCIINYSAATGTKETPNGRVQRLAINLEKELDFYYLNRDERDRHLRSMLFFVPKQFILNINFGQRVLRSLLNSYKLLRVLKFEDIFMRISFKLPGEIGNLVHLQFLSLRNTKMQELPSSVGNLVCLQTLDLRGTNAHVGLLLKVPNVLWKMEKLRHVYLPSIIRGEGLSFATHASNLQTVVNVSVSASDLYDFVNLTNLRRLKVTLFGNETIEKGSLTFDNLQSLSMASFHDGAWNVVLSCPHIYKLRVNGRIRRLPEDLLFLPNLTKLTLCGIHHDRLKDDNIEILEKLPSLRMLFLDNNAALGYFPGPLVCSAGGFPRLEFLSLHSLIELKEWRVEKGAMPGLSKLHIEHCSPSFTVPDGLRYVTTLKELIIKGVTRGFGSRLEEGGEEFYKIQHVNSVLITDFFASPSREYWRT